LLASLLCVQGASLAVINAVGFESQGVIENLLSSVAAGVSWDTTIKRSGAASGRCNASAATAFFTFGAYDLSTATHGNMARTAETFFTFYMYFATLPSATMGTVRFRASSGSEIVRINVGTGGAVTLVGTATSATVATLSTGQWYRMEMRVTSNGTCGLSIDGGTEVTVTGNNFTLDRIIMGPNASATADVYFDDLVIDTTTFHIDPQITIGKPTGAGTHTAWTNGTGTTYAVVDEIPMNTGDYIQNTSGTNAAHTFTMESSATIGFSNTITAVIPFLAVVEPTSTTTSISVRLRSGGTDYDSTAADLGTSTRSSKAWINELDPDTGAAWTSSDFDNIEVGVLKGSDSSSVRVLEVYVMVLTTVVVVPALLVLSAAAGVATATTVLASPTSLSLSSAAGGSSPSLSLQAPTALTLQSIAGLSSSTLALRSPSLLTLSTVSGAASPTIQVSSPVFLALNQVDGVATAAGTVITANGIMVLSLVAGLSSPTLALASPTMLSLSAVAGVATPTLALQSPALLTLSQIAGLATPTLDLTAPGVPYLTLHSDGLSSASNAVTTPVFLTMQAGGIATAAATVQTSALLVLGTMAGVASPTLGLTSPALLVMTADGVATSTMALTAPALLSLSSAAGLSNATMGVISPALFTLLADGLSSASLAVKSPALLTLSTGGVALPTMGLSSPAILVLSTAAGIATVAISEISLGPTTRARIGAGLVEVVGLPSGVAPTLRVTAGHIPIVRISGGTMRPVIIQAGTARPVRINGGY
jgi:hypothetical protein